VEAKGQVCFVCKGIQDFPVPSSFVYIGIDVACAVGKKLPICVVSTGHPLMPLAIPKQLAGLIPLGVGNKEIIAATPFQQAAQDVLSAINHIVDEMGWKVEESRSMLQPRRLQQVLGHRRMNLHVLACPFLERLRHPLGQEYARSAQRICALAALQQPCHMPTKFAIFCKSSG
jgi:hypothetical protein